MRKKVLVRVLQILGALIVLGYLGLYLFQDKIIFQTVKLNRDYAFKFEGEFHEDFIPLRNAIEPGGDPDTLNVLAFYAPDSLRAASNNPLILYFHGNRGNLQRWGNYAKDFTKLGFDVIMVDYRGYGKSTGHPSEENLYEDAHMLYDYAINLYKPDRLVIYGRSLGSAVASELAAYTMCDLLVLETPFDELRGVVPSPWEFLAPILPFRYTMSNSDHLKEVDARVVIFHGTDDRIVPLSSALRLKPLLRSPDDFIIIPDGGHRNLRTFQEYQSRLAQVLDSL